MANKVILNGNLGKAAEINAEETRAIINVATKEYYKGEEHTEWHRVAFFGKLVEVCKKLEKGQRVYIEAKLQTSKVEKEGEKTQYFVNINGTSIEF